MQYVRFFHIPKTGGSTFADILKRQYIFYDWFRFSGDIQSDLKRYLKHNGHVRLFIGHAPLKTGIQIADYATMFTLLRDPVSRVKSFCQHVYEGKSKYLIDRFPPYSFDLDEFLDSGNHELSNLQAKLLSSDRDFESLTDQ